MPAVPMTPTGNRKQESQLRHSQRRNSQRPTQIRDPSGRQGLRRIFNTTNYPTTAKAKAKKIARVFLLVSLCSALLLYLLYCLLFGASGVRSLSRPHCTPQGPSLSAPPPPPTLFGCRPALRFFSGRLVRRHALFSRGRWRPPWSTRTGRRRLRRAGGRGRRRSCTCGGGESPELATSALGGHGTHHETTNYTDHGMHAARGDSEFRTYLAAKRSASAFSAAAKNSSISSSAGFLALQAADAAAKDIGRRWWCFGWSSAA